MASPIVVPLIQSTSQLHLLARILTVLVLLDLHQVELGRWEASLSVGVEVMKQTWK